MYKTEIFCSGQGSMKTEYELQIIKTENHWRECHWCLLWNNPTAYVVSFSLVSGKFSRTYKTDPYHYANNRFSGQVLSRLPCRQYYVRLIWALRKLKEELILMCAALILHRLLRLFFIYVGLREKCVESRKRKWYKRKVFFLFVINAISTKRYITCHLS